MPERTLLIPVEVRARELRSRLLFGAEAARRGYRVLIGESRVLHRRMSSFPRGLIVENDVTVSSFPYLTEARRQGFGVIAWDEEAIATVSPEWYVTQRVAPASLNLVDRLYTVGAADTAAIAERLNGHAHRLLPAGNPRIDLLRREAERRRGAAAPRGQGFVLVISRFSRSNPYAKTREEVLDTVRRKFSLDERALAFYDAFLHHTDALYARFLELVRVLPDAMPDRHIVVRPHPSESWETWERVAATHPRCEVRTEGTAVEWADRADAVVHNGCTAGLEAALLGRPVIAYTPVTSDAFDVRLPNEVSVQTPSTEELIAAIRQARADDVAAQDQRLDRAWRVASRSVASCTGPTATERILEDLASLSPSERPAPAATVARALHHARQTRQRWRTRRTPPDAGLEQRRAGYLRQKFATVTTSALRDELDALDAGDVQARQGRLGWWELRGAQAR